MTWLVVIRLAVVLSVCAVASVQAHHSHPYFYDQCRSVTIEGRVESVAWKDPHTLIVLRQDDGTVYTVDWNPATRLTNRGIAGPAETALMSGTRIAVTGNPIRSSAEIRTFIPDYAYEVNPNILDPTLIRSVDGSWSWSRTPSDRMSPSILPPCAGAPEK